MRISLARQLASLVLLPILAGHARAQYIPPFSQYFTHPTGHSGTSVLHFNVSPFDTAVTFQPLAPPDNDFGTAPITSSIDFHGESLHWALILDMGPNGTLLRTHDYTPANQCNAVFRLYGVGPGDTAFVTVRVISSLAFVRSGSPFVGLSRGRASLTTNLGTAAHEATYYHGDPLFTTRDTLEVPVRVLGDDQFLQFQLNLLAHVEEIDGGSPRVDVTADVSFRDVPPGMSVVNAYGYGHVELGAPVVEARPGTLKARPGADGRQVLLGGVAPGEAEVALFDLAGRRLARARPSPDASGQAEITLLEPLTSGIYFVRCTDARGVRSTRFAYAR